MTVLIELLATIWDKVLTALKWFIATFGIAGVVVVGMYVYYDGLPIVKNIPFIGWLAEGKVQHTADAATAAAKTSCESDKSKMVDKATVTALQTQLKVMEQQRQAAEIAASTYRASADKARKEAEDAQAKLDAKIAADNGAGGAVVGTDDLDWMSK